ncbi:hypothetical protein [Candidatus Pelagibacter ubique]|jgi:hypothetical protein|uniref:hypothetical protein n=1 Tax=Pelagibacter ubique TaxID=198252 RepID=UPI0003C7FF3C|tara:strand:+ start:1219 stop:1476 length:258 start_codon:yes stop_codon:yes gene_type:complete
MNFEIIKKILTETFQEKLTQKSKSYISISLGWIIFIGYLTWWNGLKSMSLDKSFRWDEWFWFGIIPATVPYLFYFIWKKKDTEDH